MRWWTALGSVLNGFLARLMLDSECGNRPFSYLSPPSDLLNMTIRADSKMNSSFPDREMHVDALMD